MFRAPPTHASPPDLEALRLKVRSHELNHFGFSELHPLFDRFKGRAIFPRQSDDFVDLFWREPLMRFNCHMSSQGKLEIVSNDWCGFLCRAYGIQWKQYVAITNLPSLFDAAVIDANKTQLSLIHCISLLQTLMMIRFLGWLVGGAMVVGTTFRSYRPQSCFGQEGAVKRGLKDRF